MDAEKCAAEICRYWSPVKDSLVLLLLTQEVDQVFWDNSNHLYAIGSEAGKLWVFTVTAHGVTQAPGSPHVITNPADMIVLPR
ncbi:MAG TPA: hypothetical protein VMX38_09565 [Verrucomicrobiae bacterium]|nr:hypothetical protein [Verrucomicrobiae bacterium]